MPVLFRSGRGGRTRLGRVRVLGRRADLVIVRDAGGARIEHLVILFRVCQHRGERTFCGFVCL